MRKTAFLFPGQGSQSVGMGLDFFKESSLAAEHIMKADAILGRPISKLCFQGPAGELTKTENAQPALFLIDYISGLLLRENGIIPSALAGHSLGEYAAVALSGALDFSPTLQLVSTRADLMKKAAYDHPGGMWAVLGLEAEEVDDIISRHPGYWVANYNCPGQVIISGEKTGVTIIEDEFKQHGAKKLVPLNVTGAFHCPLMTQAAEEMKAQLASVRFKPAKIPLYSNLTAGPTTEPEIIRENLANQICGSVRWEQSIRAIIAAGTSVFIEAGPGKVLTGLMKRIEPEVSIFSVEDMESLEKVVCQIGGTD